MSDDKLILNQINAANLLSVTTRTLRTWDDLPNPPPRTQGKRGQPNAYPARELVAWYLEYRLGQLTSTGDGSGDPAAMRARLDRLRGDQVELDLKIKSGDYAPINIIRDVIGDVASQLKAILESLPRKIKHAQPELTARALRIVHSEIVRAMNACSEVRVKFDIVDEYESDA